MNSILYIVRKAKGLTERQLSRILEIDEKKYMEIENELRLLDEEMSLKLGKIFNIPADHFLINPKREAQLRANAMKEVISFLTLPSTAQIPPEIQIKMIAMGTQALMAHQELNAAHYEINILKRENEVIRNLYMNLAEGKDVK